MKEFIVENKLAISILSIWVFFHFVILSSINDNKLNKDYFYPFDNDLGLFASYDFTEFMVYGIFPVLAFVLAKVLSSRA